MGIVLAGTAMRTELKSIEQYNQMLLLGCFALLVVVFIPGTGSSVNGARRWINLGFLQVPDRRSGEGALHRVAVQLRCASATRSMPPPVMLKPLGVAGALVVLLLLQPDFGSSTLLLAITAGMLVLGG